MRTGRFRFANFASAFERTERPQPLEFACRRRLLRFLPRYNGTRALEPVQNALGRFALRKERTAISASTIWSGWMREAQRALAFESPIKIS